MKNEQQIQVERELCRIRAMVYKTIQPAMIDPCDGFCDLCPNSGTDHFRSTMDVIDYIRAAVVETLKVDGYKIAKGFDPDTGKEITDEDDLDSLPAT